MLTPQNTIITAATALVLGCEFNLFSLLCYNMIVDNTGMFSMFLWR